MDGGTEQAERGRSGASPALCLLLPEGEALALPALPLPLREIADMGEAAADDHILWGYPSPARALAQRLAAGAGTADALADWRDGAAALLAAARPLRRRLTLFDLDAARAAAPDTLAAALAARLDLCLDDPAQPVVPEPFPTPPADPLLHLLAAACLAADPAARRLLAELEASSLALPPADAAPPDAALAALRDLQQAAAARAGLELQTDAMQAEIARLETAVTTARAEAAALKTTLDQSLERQSQAEAALARAAEEAAALTAARAELQDRLAAAEAARAEAEAASSAAPAREAVLAAQILRLGRDTDRLRAAPAGDDSHG